MTSSDEPCCEAYDSADDWAFGVISPPNGGYTGFLNKILPDMPIYPETESSFSGPRGHDNPLAATRHACNSGKFAAGTMGKPYMVRGDPYLSKNEDVTEHERP